MDFQERPKKGHIPGGSADVFLPASLAVRHAALGIQPCQDLGGRGNQEHLWGHGTQGPCPVPPGPPGDEPASPARHPPGCQPTECLPQRAIYLPAEKTLL